jgi:hypothetical protein
MTSEIERRADELRDVARACKTLNDFAKATGFSMEIARHAAKLLSLDLPDATPRGGAVRVAVSCPKPTKAKPKP